MSEVRSFPPAPQVPSVITAPDKIAEYLVQNYWNAFLSTSRKYFCDSLTVNGVAADNVNSAICEYASLLENAVSLSFAKREIEALVDKMEAFQAFDPSSNVFSFFENSIGEILYDPNSPLRDEDIYGPFAARLALSSFTPEEMKPKYSHEASLCKLNTRGTKAADISFTDLAERQRTLYQVDAGLILLFFSNPGCPACGEITEQLCSDALITQKIAAGDLAVVNLYIDKELRQWRVFAEEYPKEWIVGYDHNYSIRSDLSYNVRAIPSLYLLDYDKNVILKDAVPEKVIAAIRAHFSQSE